MYEEGGLLRLPDTNKTNLSVLYIDFNTPGVEKKKLGEQVNQKLLYRESDWWYVGLMVQKTRKQGTVC